MASRNKYCILLPVGRPEPVTIHEFIRTKRDAEPHSPDEIRQFIQALTRGEIPDYQVTAWLMAAYLNGLDYDETATLTQAMAESGETVNLAGLPRPVVDKHSTGGVGDAVTIILLPLLAACGLTIVKMSGRGLGHTGGTIDKMEAIPGFRTDLSPEQLVSQAKRIGCALGAQTANLAPADKILYALRDATETVASISLIAASVMSKKLASGADAIVIDVKVGNGAFMKSLEQATELAKTLVAIGERSGRAVRTVITDMNQPLAPAIGNALEVRAAIRELQTGCKNRLGQVVRLLANTALSMAGVKADVDSAISSGAALNKLREWISVQGGDDRVVEDPDAVLPVSSAQRQVISQNDGYIASFETAELGEIARDLGAGRRQKDDVIDHGVGIELHAKIGDRISEGQPIFTIHAKTDNDVVTAERRLQTAYTTSASKPETRDVALGEF